MRNPRYSLRAFARDLKVDPSFLSRLMSGKAEPSVNLTSKIVQRMNLSDGEKRRFIAAIVDDRQRNIAKAFIDILAKPDEPSGMAHRIGASRDRPFVGSPDGLAAG